MVAGAPEFVHNFTRDTLRPLVREGALRIIMLGDERMCSGVPAEDVQAVAAAVQSALNSSFQDRFGAWWPGLRRGHDYWVYLNECCHQKADGTVFDCPFSHPIMPELDLISFDVYDSGKSESKAVQQIMTKYIYPNLAPHQSAMVVPGLFGDLSKPVSDNDEAMLLEKLAAYWSWTQSDPHIIGLCTWHWANRGKPTEPGATMNRGVSSYPKVVSAIQKIVESMVPRACGRGFSGPACGAAPCCSSCSSYCATRPVAEQCNATQKEMEPACNCGEAACHEMCRMDSYCATCDHEC